MSKLKFHKESFFKSLLNIKFFVFLSNFVFQGMRYMTKGELSFKLAITLVLAGMLHFLIDSILLSIFLGHSINFIINGQFFVLGRYLFSSDAISPRQLTEFVALIEYSYPKYDVKDVLIIGSFCRVQMSRTSDLDLRIWHAPGIVPSLKAYSYAFYLRFISIFKRFPMDVYCFSDFGFLQKIRKDESPSFFNGSEKYRFEYPNARNIHTVLSENIVNWKC